MNLCRTCKHAEWFKRSRDGLCRLPFEVSDIKLPHGVYFFNEPYIGRTVLHKKGQEPQDCIGYEFDSTKEERGA